MRIRSASGRYQVRMAPGLLDLLTVQPGNRLLVADERFADRLGGLPAVLVPATEDTKTMAGAERVVAALRKVGCNRASTLVAVGGGVVQDVAAFAASIYMRGIPWIYAPTTLLAMADSCIGGKSSINVAGQKNLVGTVHPPAEVLIDPDLTLTLDVEQRVAGLCEAAKICFARGPRAFDRYMVVSIDPACDGANLAPVIALSLASKKWFIEVDEFDRNERLLLNFGHTFGHAIEDASGFQVSHGVAVGLGMLVALELAQLQGARLGANALRLHRHVLELLHYLPFPPCRQSRLDPDRLLAAFDKDKKHSREAYAVIIPDDSDRLTRRLLPRDQATRQAIGRSFAAVLHMP
jgi:3-dehydroquinate synthase